jgi:hypothetical protein
MTFSGSSVSSRLHHGSADVEHARSCRWYWSKNASDAPDWLDGGRSWGVSTLVTYLHEAPHTGHANTSLVSTKPMRHFRHIISVTDSATSIDAWGGTTPEARLDQRKGVIENSDYGAGSPRVATASCHEPLSSCSTALSSRDTD